MTSNPSLVAPMFDLAPPPDVGTISPRPTPKLAVVQDGLELSPQQAEAVNKITHWFHGPQQVFRLFGYAGTGKSSIAKHIVEQLDICNVVFAAFTGKAAFVLRTKGCDNARTIHSLIYMPKEKVRARLEELRKELKTEDDTGKRLLLERAIRVEEHKLDSPDWTLRDPDESDLTDAGLLVVDEVSMVGHTMAADLLGFGVKTLVLGDPAQLPPVDGGGYFIDAEPDHLLTEIHRSALDSPVTRLATTVRNSTPGDRGYGVDGADGDNGRIDRLTIDELLGFDQMLVGKNATRWQATHLLRALRGLTGVKPMPSDRIMVLANSGDAEVFNGQQFTVNACDLVPQRDDQFRLKVTDDDGRTRPLTVWASGFVDIDGEREAKRNGRGSVVAATFGWAVTVHKAQGSQWNNVLVVDESSVFYGAAYREHVRQLGRNEATARAHLNGRRWLYTAVTRAAHRVVMVPQLAGMLA